MHVSLYGSHECGSLVLDALVFRLNASVRATVRNSMLAA